MQSHPSRFLQLLGVFALALTAALAACGDSKASADDPAEALKRHFAYADKGQWSKMYDTLHPAQQALIDRDLYLRCAAEKSRGIAIDRVTVLETGDDERAVIGTDVRGTVKTVTYEIKFRQGLLENTIRSTMNLFLVDGRYRWQTEPQPYIEGRCP